ncbi:MAG: hypothetical protein JZD40_01265, partial [Sulfolobus sp.]|nr:hypothetical protein [Sulfolobus sp.]
MNNEYKEFLYRLHDVFGKEEQFTVNDILRVFPKLKVAFVTEALKALVDAGYLKVEGDKYQIIRLSDVEYTGLENVKVPDAKFEAPPAQQQEEKQKEPKVKCPGVYTMLDWAERWDETGHKVVALKDKKPLHKWSEDENGRKLSKNDVYPHAIQAIEECRANQIAIELLEDEECFDFEFLDYEAVERFMKWLGVNIHDYYYYNTQKGFRLCYKTKQDHHDFKISFDGHPILEVNRKRLVIVPPSLPDSDKQGMHEYGDIYHNLTKYKAWAELNYEPKPREALLVLLNCTDKGEYYECNNAWKPGRLSKDFTTYIEENGTKHEVKLSPEPKEDKIKMTITPAKPPTVNVTSNDDRAFVESIIRDNYKHLIDRFFTQVNPRLRDVVIKLMRGFKQIRADYQTS